MVDGERAAAVDFGRAAKEFDAGNSMLGDIQGYREMCE
jgi:hypothetical protein